MFTCTSRSITFTIVPHDFRSVRHSLKMCGVWDAALEMNHRESVVINSDTTIRGNKPQCTETNAKLT